MKSKVIDWLLSFVKPRKTGLVITNGSDCIDVSNVEKKDPNRLISKYRPYATTYLFVGIVRTKKGESGYRFKDTQTGMEFTLTEKLARLLLYRVD